MTEQPASYAVWPPPRWCSQCGAIEVWVDTTNDRRNDQRPGDGDGTDFCYPCASGNRGPLQHAGAQPRAAADPGMDWPAQAARYAADLVTLRAELTAVRAEHTGLLGRVDAQARLTRVHADAVRAEREALLGRVAVLQARAARAERLRSERDAANELLLDRVDAALAREADVWARLTRVRGMLQALRPTADALMQRRIDAELGPA